MNLGFYSTVGTKSEKRNRWFFIRVFGRVFKYGWVRPLWWERKDYRPGGRGYF